MFIRQEKRCLNNACIWYTVLYARNPSNSLLCFHEARQLFPYFFLQKWLHTSKGYGSHDKSIGNIVGEQRPVVITLFFFKRIKKSFLSDLEMSYSALAKHNSPEEIRKHDVASIFNYIIARLSNCFLKVYQWWGFRQQLGLCQREWIQHHCYRRI